MERTEVIKKENNILINDILTRNYYTEFSKDDSDKNIELIINRKNIKSKCYGCFNNTEEKLYPHIDFSENNYDLIYGNLVKFLKYYSDMGWKCPVELNGIDWANDEIAEKFLILLQNCSNKSNYNFPKKIIVDLDFRSFCTEEHDLNRKFRKRYEAFKKIGINLFFNIHANGLYCDDNEYDELFYTQLLFWLTSFHIDTKSYKIISYIRPNNVKNWIKNYKWWIDKLGENAFTHIQLIEEKSDKWTYENISDYLLFLKFQIEYLKDYYSEEEFIRLIYDKKQDIIFQNISLLENQYLNNVNKHNDCNFFKNLTIDLTTLNIVPCARINYEDFACAQYISDDNNIIGIRAKNIPIIIYNTHLKQSCLPHCEMCPHIEFCSGHCFAESYNKCYDMLVPIREFCNLSKSKINFLVYYYDKINLINEELMEKLGCNSLYIKYIMKLANELKEI